MRRLSFLAGAALLAALLPWMVVAPSSGADTGDTVHNIIVNRDGTACASYNDAGDHGSVSTGIAFDGVNLLMSCWSDSSLTVHDPITGDLLETNFISGAQSLGALAYDGTRGLLYGCSDYYTIGIVDLAADSFTPMFDTSAMGGRGCLDGLAYDASDDTFWASFDVASTVEHFSYSGTLLSSTNVVGGSGVNIGAGSSGIAVGGDLLYLANNGHSQIYEAAKDFSSAELFAGFERRIEDLECDNVTFADQGVAVMWQQDAYDNVVNAFEIPDGSCKFGGGVDIPACTAAGDDPGIVFEDTAGQTLHDDHLSSTGLLGDPDHSGPISGPLNDGLDETPLEPVGDEATCAVSVFPAPDGDGI